MGVIENIAKRFSELGLDCKLEYTEDSLVVAFTNVPFVDLILIQEILDEETAKDSSTILGHIELSSPPKPDDSDSQISE